MKPPASNLPTPQQNQLLRAALLEGKAAEQAWQQWKEHADIDELDGASYRLLPLLHHNLVHLGIDDDWMPRLKGISRYHWCKNQMLLGRLGELVRHMQDAGIPVLVLKGSALILRYYDSAALRPMSDLDIMVRPEQLEHAGQVMKRHGWSRKSPFNLTESRVRRVHHAELYIDSSGNECDLHWTPIVSGTWEGSEDWYWRNANKMDFKGCQVWILEPTEQLFHTLVHGGHYNVFPPIRWIADAFYIIRQDGDNINWSRLLELARRYFCTALLIDSLNHLVTAHDLSLPEEAQKMIRRVHITSIDRFRKNLISNRVPLYRLDLLIMKAWIRHSRRWPGAAFIPRLMSFPGYFRELLSAPSWREVPASIRAFIAQRY